MRWEEGEEVEDKIRSTKSKCKKKKLIGKKVKAQKRANLEKVQTQDGSMENNELIRQENIIHMLHIIFEGKD